MEFGELGSSGCGSLVDEVVERPLEGVLIAASRVDKVVEDSTVDDVVVPEVGIMLATPANSSFGRERVSATTLALPSTYRTSIMYSATHELVLLTQHLGIGLVY